MEREHLLCDDEKLATDETTAIDSQPRYFIARNWPRLRILLSAIFLLSVASLTTVAITTQESLDASSYPGCGNSPAEAKAMGCIFDLMNYAWTPQACYDEELSTTALQSGPWGWYYDHNATQPIPQNTTILSQIEHLWTEHHFHVAHCLYAFKNIHKATITGRMVSEDVVSWNHTLHCENMLSREKMNMRKVNTKVTMIFNHCARLDEPPVERH